MMRAEDWTALGWASVYKSGKLGLDGVELEDLYQCAMLGIHRATLNYREKVAGFEAHARWYIQKEINEMVYRTVRDSNGKLTRQPRIKYDEDIGMDDELYEDNVDSLLWVGDFLDGINLNVVEKAFFVYMIQYGDKEAVKLYREETGNSRARASAVMKKIKEVAKQRLEMLENNYGY
jgi:hypothetical protein